MKRLLVTIAMIASIAVTAPAFAIELEPGATFNGGTCIEADGTPGLSQMDGQCITAADYDILFSYENLSTVETFDPFDGDTTVAERYNIEPGSQASERPRSFMGQELPSFAGDIKVTHGLFIL